MFIPFGFEYAYQRIAFVTIALLTANVAMAAFVGMPGPDNLALQPEDFRIYQLVTSTFLHVDWFHLVGNLLFLWVFGRYVEDRLGPWRFAALYFAAAIVASLAQLALGGNRPAVGASGAISALLGYLLVAAPWLEMRCAIAIGFYASRGVELAAGWILVPWLGFQLLEAAMGSLAGVAVAAHLGGFVFGAAAAGVMRSRLCRDTGWYIDPRPPLGGRAALDRLHRARGAPAGRER